MSLFSDETLLDALLAAHRRGVTVRVMRNPARRSGEPAREPTRKDGEHRGYHHAGHHAGRRAGEG